MKDRQRKELTSSVRRLNDSSISSDLQIDLFPRSMGELRELSHRKTRFWTYFSVMMGLSAFPSEIGFVMFGPAVIFLVCPNHCEPMSGLQGMSPPMNWFPFVLGKGRDAHPRD